MVQTLGESESGGFVDLRDVISRLQALGYTPEQIDFHLTRCYQGHLAELADHGDAGQLIRVLPAGAYLYKRLVSSFPYIDAVVVDTPIIDPVSRGRIRDVFDIDERIDRAEAFVQYLDESWPFGDELVSFSWQDTVSDWSRTLESVRRGATRAAERRRR